MYNLPSRLGFRPKLVWKLEWISKVCCLGLGYILVIDYNLLTIEAA